ncbi:unnamed protein product [Didymodactylos carnosus]|uniref:Uncharacterized protein n=1 Tax=Didymodactylos carnosus TaxID=1234261 RepID=A0A814Q8D9_9BILA|nr:unnamed protein product [Didymodactylos carnosus]CAF3880617.1 unnamed protein product [Didymodactylos carnosus]
MNETVDSVRRFVTDQSSFAADKMSSIFASLRRRFGTNAGMNETDQLLLAINDARKIIRSYHNEMNANLLTVTSSYHYSIDRLEKYLHIAQQHYQRILLYEQQQNTNGRLNRRSSIREHHSKIELTDTIKVTNELRSLIEQTSNNKNTYSFFVGDDNNINNSSKDGEKYLNAYDTLNKNRNVVRSNPTLNEDISDSNGKIHRQKFRNSMRNMLKRQLTSTTRKVSKTKTPILGNDSYNHIYETLESSSPIKDETTTEISTPKPQEPSPKCVYLLPSSLVVLDHFTTNLYLAVNTSLNQILVVFGSTKIHTIKTYNTDGKKTGNDLILNYKYEDLHGYKLLCCALNNSNQYRIIVNEIRVYAKSPPLPQTTPITAIEDFRQTMKQRLLFFDDVGRYICVSKRIPVQNEIFCVEIDRNTTSIYVYDGELLLCLDRGWTVPVENAECIACGATFLVCLHMKTNQISVYNSTNGQFSYRWIISSSSVTHLQCIHLCVSKNDEIYVLTWNRDVSPSNNLILVFNEEGHLQREICIPNKITLNVHGKYEYTMTIGGGQQSHQNQFSTLMKRQQMKLKPAIPPVQLANSDSSLMWMQRPTHLVWGTPSRFPFAPQQNPWAFQRPPLNYSNPPPAGLGIYGGYDRMMMRHPQSDHSDPTIFRACFVAITDDGTLIVSNISDLGMDEDISQGSEIRLNRKIVFFHLGT